MIRHHFHFVHLRYCPLLPVHPYHQYHHHPVHFSHHLPPHYYLDHFLPHQEQDLAPPAPALIAAFLIQPLLPIQPPDGFPLALIQMMTQTGQRSCCHHHPRYCHSLDRHRCHRGWKGRPLALRGSDEQFCCIECHERMFADCCLTWLLSFVLLGGVKNDNLPSAEGV